LNTIALITVKQFPHYFVLLHGILSDLFVRFVRFVVKLRIAGQGAFVRITYFEAIPAYGSAVRTGV
jgi:hypothetical protein